MDIRGMDRYLDFWNLMAYDYAGSWDATAGHQANLYPARHNPSCTPFSTKQAVDHYLQHIHPQKLVLGIPLYGRAFENTDGPGKPYSGIGAGSWENGIWDYKALPLAGSAVHEDRESGATYEYNAASRKMVTYDTPRMAAQKAEFVKAHNMGGAMYWESSGDKTGEESIVGTVTRAFGGERVLLREENCLDYPHSQYDNLRKGFQ